MPRWAPGVGYRLAHCSQDAREEHKERVLQLFGGGRGKTQAEIAAELGCSQATISRILKASGVIAPRRGWVRKHRLR